MFSRLEPFFKTSFRQTEYADARLMLREKEKQKSRNQSHDDFTNEDEQDLWTDQTVVSIDALRTFLISFLRNEVESENNDKDQSKRIQNIQSTDSPPNALNGRAAQAYKTTAMRNAETEPQENSMPQSIHSVKIEEIRVMNQLITDLNKLASNNIEHIVIPKEDSFLKSLQSAVQKAQNQ